MLKRLSLSLILVAALAVGLSPQPATSQEYLVDKVMSLTAPAGGVAKREQ